MFFVEVRFERYDNNFAKEQNIPYQISGVRIQYLNAKHGNELIRDLRSSKVSITYFLHFLEHKEMFFKS